MMIFSKIYYKIKKKIDISIDNNIWGDIGKHSHVIKPMRILGKRRMFIGNNVNILNQARLETIHIWQGAEYNGKLQIGDNTSIEQCCHIISAENVTIGENCVISAFVYISDCNHGIRPDKHIMETQLETDPVSIGNHCFIGIGSCILPGVTLGDNVVVGANSVVTKDIPPFSIVAGSPAKIIKKISIESYPG